MAEAHVALVGTLDTKGREYEFVRDQLSELNCASTVIDCGVLGDPPFPPDFSQYDVARAARSTLQELRNRCDRSHAMQVAATGSARIVERLVAERRIGGVLVLGGSNAAYVMAIVAEALPLGFPKVLVSTAAAGDTRPYVGGHDITMINPITDLVGLNQISRPVLSNAAAALAGMVTANCIADRREVSTKGETSSVAVTMSGITTACVTQLRQQLERRDLEVLVFHANGAGGAAMESIIETHNLAGVVDVTTTELADDLVGGMRSAGPNRMKAAGARRVPQVVSLGGLDVVNFGSPDSVPERFAPRLLHPHNPSVTLMRTSIDENRTIGAILAHRLNQSRGPVSVFIPERGLSSLSVAGGVFEDPEADRALFEALTVGLKPDIEVNRMSVDINHPSFATAMAHTISRYIPMQPPS